MAVLDLEALQTTISAVFDQVQLSAANHRKNCVALYKLHVRTSEITEPTKDGKSVKLTGERAFSDVFLSMVTRVIVVKKGTTPADRVVRFISAYIKFMNEKAGGQSEEEEEEETMMSRFVARVLKWLLQGFEAKDKNVRFRLVQLVSEIISHIGEIDEQTYSLLRSSLVQRLHDKESMIRAHTVIALSKLCSTEDPEEEDTEESVMEMLIDALTLDSAPEVRRCALVNLPLNSMTLDHILERMRDVDTLTRKLVYSAALSTKLSHPKQLTIAQREQVVKDGLGDREPVVRLAAGKLITAWFDIFVEEASNAEKKEGEEDDVHMRGLARFLQAFDLVGPGLDIAADALSSIFVTRPEVLDTIIFTESFWKNLTAETAVLARVFIHHCIDNKLEGALEAARLPVVTAFAFSVQAAYNAILEIDHSKDLGEYADIDEQEEARDARETEQLQLEAVVGELLRISTTLDYADEIGRRKMFAIVRDMLAQDTLPESLIERCMDVLHEITPNERELIRIVVELVVELRDNEVGETVLDGLGGKGDDSLGDMTQVSRAPSVRRSKQRHEMSNEEAQMADSIDLRCLCICTSMLERVEGTFEDNAILEGILTDLVIPCVKRKEQLLREKGLVTLALCCLIAKDMALSSLQLFLNQVSGAPPELKCKVLQALFDFLITYEKDLFDANGDISQRIITFFLQVLESESSHAVQTVLCIGLAKLLMSGLLTETQVLTDLVALYVSPSSAENSELRQCLSYFFPVYCYSSPVNQSRLRSVFTAVFDVVAQAYDDREEDQDMITPYQLGLQMIDWLDAHKLVDHDSNAAANESHLDLTVDILAALHNTDRNVEHQKALCQLLTNLQLPSEPENRSLMKISLLLTHLSESNSLDDVASEKFVEKFKARFRRQYKKQLDALNPGHYTDNEFKELYAFIDVEMPEPEQPDAQDPPQTNGIDEPVDKDDHEPSAAPEPDREDASTPTPTSKELSNGTQEVVSDEEQEDTPPSPSPESQKPRRSSRSTRRSSTSTTKSNGRQRKSSLPTKEPTPPPPDEEEEEQSAARPATPPPEKKKAGRQRKPSAPTKEPTPPPPDHDEEEEQEQIAARPVTPPPEKKRPGRQRKPPAPARKPAPPPPDEEEEEEAQIPERPVTPPPKKSKRARSPTLKQALPSPNGKKRTRTKSPQRGKPKPNGKAAAPAKAPPKPPAKRTTRTTRSRKAATPQDDSGGDSEP